MQRMLLIMYCNVFVIWACAVAATIAFDFASGGMLPCLIPVSLFLTGGILTWFGMFVVACFSMFVSARWYADMFWHGYDGMVVTCLLEHFWQVLSWVADRTRQDHAKILKKKDAGRAAFSTLFDVFLLAHGIDDNHNLTTPTQHVMVGITRSKIIIFKSFLFY